jgi:hypothetical protein
MKASGGLEGTLRDTPIPLRIEEVGGSNPPMSTPVLCRAFESTGVS